MARAFYVTCPCCKTLLEVEGESGDVLKKWAPSEQNNPGDDKMTSALKQLEENKKKRASLFDKTKEGLEEQRKKVDEAFRKEVERAKKEGVNEKPLRPFDLD